MTAPTELTRPIIGIENRTAQEVFDIMCDRIRSALVSAPAVPDAVRARLAMARGHLSNIEAHGNAEANAVLVIRNVLAELEAALAASHMPVGDGYVPAAQKCATDRCEKPASVHFIRGGIGSYYCHDCYMHVQSLAASTGEANHG